MLLIRIFEVDRETLFPHALPLIFLSNPFIQAGVGMEAFLSIMLGLLAVFLWQRERRVAASLVCSMAVLARPDMLLLPGVVLAYDWLRRRRLPSLRMVLVFSIPLAGWCAFSLIYFGDALPTSP